MRFPPLSLREVCDVLLADSPRKILSFGEKSHYPRLSLGSKAALSVNNRGLMRGFILWAGARISFSLVVVSALLYGKTVS